MLGYDRSGLTCPNKPGLPCPLADCPGRVDPAVCRLVDALTAWRLNPSSGSSVAGAITSLPPLARRPPRGDRVRVGLWSPGLWHGGAESWMLALLRHCDRSRIEWTGVVATLGPAAIMPAMGPQFEELASVDGGLDAARELASRSDVILLWGGIPIREALESVPDRPAIVSACHIPPEWDHGLYCSTEGIDHLVAVSEIAREVFPPDRRESARVIWNAVDPARLAVTRPREAIRRLWGVPEGIRVAGYLGRFSGEKDPRAMARLAADLPAGWVVVAVGGGEELGPIRDEGSDRLILPGPDPRAGDVLNAFDTLIVPSKFESFGLTLAEGLWMRIPVVSTPAGLAKMVPGLTREVRIGASGRELAGAILADLADPEGTAGRVEHASLFARQRLSPERFGREWTDCLTGLVPTETEGSPCRPMTPVA